MPRLVISTVGTSLLTNAINEDKDPKKWISDLTKTANWTQEKIESSSDYSHVFSKIIVPLERRIAEKLDDSNILEIREMSAELNGIHGLYDEKIEDGRYDTHILITTDTAQGKATSQILESFLKSKGIEAAFPLIQPELSISSTAVFTEAMAKLIPNILEMLNKYKDDKYQICFNLVGGFKALQGYFNTIGMFYADEIIYIFEGSDKSIKIPKLPISIDIGKVEKYKVQLAMMEAAAIPTFWEEAKKVPEEWVLTIDKEMILSTWGQLIWNQCKDDLLAQNLFIFPRINYADSFFEDYEKIRSTQERIKLHQTIAKVSQKLIVSKGSTEILFGGGLDFNRYKNTSIDHFRVNDSLRVTCKVLGDTLELRYYGTHDHVERSEKIKGR
ncbi:CRISPR-associated protein [Nodularia sp. UHCC 0506]|uniref:CRISPR-associated protein n=1 Tax=Nodularia sp. UHCC 0506 TaxID=3110243 RepID=UPI002B1F6DFC|nr:CRISPR-associated protein [Nodularia sp. UHCC 0506]MEA5513319.1 CRISPR-associated protein [Nodularia sp. UHCC 0506]